MGNLRDEWMRFSKEWADENPDYFEVSNSAIARFCRSKNGRHRIDTPEKLRAKLEEHGRVVWWRRRHNQERRKRVLSAGPMYSEEAFEELCEKAAHGCVYCGEAKPLTADHKVPVARGGINDISNILPACLSCNSDKCDLTAQEYVRRMRGRHKEEAMTRIYIVEHPEVAKEVKHGNT